MHKVLKNYKYNILISLGAALLFIPFLGGVHLFDWDEINFAESAREMIITRDFLNVQIDFHPFWEKPPLFIWMQVISMKIFGVNEFAARFPNAICGIITLLVVFNIGRKLLGDKFGIAWVTVYTCSLLPHLYFRSGIIDPWFNLFIFIGIYFFILYSDESGLSNKKLFTALSALFIGLAILTKGPVALLIFIITTAIFYLIRKFRHFPSITEILIFAFMLVITGGMWFLIEIIHGKTELVMNFIHYQSRLFSTKDAGHGGFLFYHFVVLFFGVFPASVFALRAFLKKNRPNDDPVKHFSLLMLILFWTVLILFTIVKTKIVHYSSMCYLPLTYLGALTLFNIIKQERIKTSWINILLIIISLLYLTGLVLLPLVETFKTKIIQSGLIKDQFAIGNLQANVNWGHTAYFAGGIYLILMCFLFFTRSKDYFRKYLLFLILNLSFIVFSIIYIVPRIEKYSQHAAIEFYQKISKENCYVETLGFKSYAHLFYSDKKPLTNSNGYDINWLLTENIDRKAYFVSKNTSATEYLQKYTDLKILYEKNGFVFLYRKPSNSE